MATATKTKPRITLLARADNTGLGNQTWEFYRHMKPAKTYVIDLNSVNAKMGKKTALHLERYPDGRLIEGFPPPDMCEEILADTDVLFTIEIPYNYLLFSMAKAKGVKTILQYNYEFLDYLANPTLPYPDLLLAPSKWHLAEVSKLPTRVKFVPVPTNREVILFRARTEAKEFLHIAGHPTYFDRNGTAVVLEAMRYVKSPINLTIYCQYSIEVIGDNRITINNIDVENYWEIYDKQFDVLLLPRRYGGLSLQLNEALAAGMPVIMTDVKPQNQFLPPGMLIKSDGENIIQTRTQIECAKPDAVALAERIDYLYNHPEEVKSLSRIADDLAAETSWEALKKHYYTIAEELCQVTGQ